MKDQHHTAPEHPSVPARNSSAVLPLWASCLSFLTHPAQHRATALPLVAAHRKSQFCERVCVREGERKEGGGWDRE